MAQGRLDTTEALHKQALAIRETQLGTDHPSTLASMNNLAVVYQSQRRYADAEMLHKQHRPSGRKNWEADHHAHNFASVYMLQGRSDEAGALYKRVLEGNENQLASITRRRSHP
jgi:tetratricopeptide (TPR) repeat protein